MISIKVIMSIVAVMVECDTVELFERIRNFASRSGKARVQWDALGSRSANVDALTLLYVTEVGCLNTATLVRDNRRFHMSQQGPRGGTEKGMRLDVGGTGSRPKSAQLVFDEQFPDQGLAVPTSC